jgi:hypothetical protein
MQQVGKYLVMGGLIIAAVGAVLWIFGNKLNWFGNLPGDIKIKRENYSFYAPIVSMLLISVVLSILIWLIGKLFK